VTILSYLVVRLSFTILYTEVLPTITMQSILSTYTNDTVSLCRKFEMWCMGNSISLLKTNIGKFPFPNITHYCQLLSLSMLYDECICFIIERHHDWLRSHDFHAWTIISAVSRSELLCEDDETFDSKYYIISTTIL